MTRLYNFSAGPATLPDAVLARIREDIPEWQGLGSSVMEVSHRGAEFMALAAAAEERLRSLLAIPAGYRVLFLQGGASLQFSAVPLNLLRGRETADYVDTGIWSHKALAEAKRYCQAGVAASNAEQADFAIPAQQDWQLNPDAAYLHYTPNETIAGVEFHWIPDSGSVPLVADMSSTILSRPLDIDRFGLIYAGAQKNIGIAGLTVVIVREDLIGEAMACTPGLLDYAVQAKSDSMQNTPCTFAWYVASLVFEWIEAFGGLEAMAEYNRRKAKKLYAAIDASDFYRNPVAHECRSWMNVPFLLADDGLNAAFLEQSKATGLLALKGHRAVGGMRASIYNAMPEAGVDSLIEFMAEFECRA